MPKTFEGLIELAGKIHALMRGHAFVSVDDIRAVARKYLVEENSVTGILKPEPEYTSSIGDKPAQAAAGGFCQAAS